MISPIRKDIELPMPVSKNFWQRCHWTVRRKHKQQWEKITWAWVNTPPRFPRPVPKVWVDLVVLWDKTGPLPDHHNLDMAHECIADGLVKAGILEDDSDGRYQRGSFTIRRPEGDERGMTVATVRTG